MPAAGMKRSTRAFGVVMKGSDSGRVLRSGRRLFPEQSVEEKTKRGKVGDDCPKQPLPSKKTAVPEKTDERERAVKRSQDGDKVDRMYGIVYSRKRRRTVRSSILEFYGKKREETVESGVGSVLSVVVKPCARRNGRFSSLLVSVLRYMRRVTVTLPELLAFFMSQPIHAALNSQGVKFLQMIRFFMSSNLMVSGLQIQNSPQFHMKFDGCQGVMIDRLSISAPKLSPNTDGIHVENSQDVGIYNSLIRNARFEGIDL